MDAQEIENTVHCKRHTFHIFRIPSTSSPRTLQIQHKVFINDQLNGEVLESDAKLVATTFESERLETGGANTYIAVLGWPLPTGKRCLDESMASFLTNGFSMS